MSGDYAAFAGAPAFSTFTLFVPPKFAEASVEVLTVSAYQIALGDDRAALGLVRMRSLAGEAGDASIDSWRRS